jgi:purine-binding chemotaxis protein CheW
MGKPNVFSPSSGSRPEPWSTCASSSNPTPSAATTSLAVFRLADNWFGIDLSRIGHVASVDYLTRLTFGPGPLLGTIGLHGRLVSVIDLKQIVGIVASPPGANSLILIARSAADEIGLLIDEFIDIFFVPSSRIARRAELSADRSATLAGECRCGDRAITLVEVEGIVRWLRMPATAPA